MTFAVGPFIGNRFIASSWDSSVDQRILDRLRATSADWTFTEGSGWRLATERGDTFGTSGDVSVALSRTSALDRGQARFRTAADVAAGLNRDGTQALSTMAPPFRAVWAQRSEAIVHAETDVFGLGQVFVSCGRGFALATSSATLLADIIDAAPSAERLAGFAQFGGFIGLETPFEGIDKLPAGHSATLQAGRLSITRRPSANFEASTVASTFRAAMNAMLAAAPDAELELSGGLDSRIILAAMSPAERRDRQAITIGISGEPSEDVEVARAIAGSEGLNWSLLEAGGLDALEPEELEALLLTAAAAYDHMANPLDKTTLIRAGAKRHVEARFGGQNGEILRGFYYPAQPLNAAPTEALARGLISVRLEANDKVEDDLLSPAARQELRQAAETRMARTVLSFDGRWGQVLDQFYLYQRMQNWVGNATGHRLMDHAPLYPFLDPAFVSAAMSLPPVEKLNSRAAYSLLAELDVSLAHRPLAGGVLPTAAARSGRLADIGMNGRRVLGRLRRVLKRQGRTTLGSQSVTDQWLRQKLYSRLPMERLLRTGLFDEAGLSAIYSGRKRPSRPSLGFLLLMTSLETRTCGG